MTFTRAPVRGRELGDRVAIPVRHPDVAPVSRRWRTGRSTRKLELAMTFTRAPVEAESSVTELPSAFATQR